MGVLNAALVLRLELALLVTFAVLFLAIPGTTIRIFGLPAAGNHFWPRLLGAVYLGQALAILASDQGWTKSGLGLGGLVAINLTGAFVLLSMLVVNGSAIPTKRGKAFLWTLALVMAALGFTAIAFAN
jgi:hypothetical protein